MKSFLAFLYAISLLSGTTIGVGFFALPYITLKVGFWTIFFYFLILGTLVFLLHQFFGELALETPDLKRLPGFAKFHLGKMGEKIAYFSSIFGIYGAILTYLIVGGEFLKEIFSPIFGGGNLTWTLVYFIFGAVLVFFDIKAIAKVELLFIVGFFLILLLTFFEVKGLIKTQNLFLGSLLPSNFFLPYGPVLFSLWGASLIPEAEEILSKRKELLKVVIFISILIVILIYLFFIYLVLGSCGSKTTDSALLCLRDLLPRKMFSLLLSFGVLTTFTSFIALALTLKKIFWYDLKMPKNLSFLITCFFPLLLFFLGFRKFIPILSFVGSVMLGIEGILILLMYQKRTQKSKIKTYLLPILFLILFIGILQKILYLIG